MKKIMLLIGCFAQCLLAVQFEGDIDVARKTKEAEVFVADAVKFFKKHSLAESMNAFRYDDKWRRGDLRITVFTQDGVLLVDGENYRSIWEDYLDEKNLADLSFVTEMIQKGEAGGWQTYTWNYALKFAYSKVVKKNGRDYIISTGFYPESAEFKTEQLVKSAVKMFYEEGKDNLFEKINNPVGSFVYGDLYLSAFKVADGKITCVAHGDNIAMVGQDITDWKDDDGKDLGAGLKAVAESPTGFAWLSYKERGEKKRAYVSRVVDKKTKTTYLISASYYEDIDDDSVKDFLRRAIDYLRANGAERSFRDFSNKAGDFVKGPMTIFVYDLEGKILADSQNPSFIGQNLIRTRDAEGNSITQVILDKAKNAGKGWVTFINKRAYYDVYVMLVKVPDGDFIIGAGYWPSSKPRSVRAFAEKGASKLSSMPAPEAFKLFASDSSEFMRGDLHITVYDEQGNVMVDGSDLSRIWKNDRDIKATRGDALVDKFIGIASSGGGWVDYRRYGSDCRAYVKRVEAQEHTAARQPEEAQSKGYIVVSSYCL